MYVLQRAKEDVDFVSIQRRIRAGSGYWSSMSYSDITSGAMSGGPKTPLFLLLSVTTAGESNT